MRLAWAGIVTAGVGLVLAALLWTFAVMERVTVDPTTGDVVDPPICMGRAELEVSCEVLGFDMRWGSLSAFVLFVLSVLLAYVAIRIGQGPRRPRRRNG